MPFFGGGGGSGFAILSNNNIDGGDNVMANVTGVNNIGIGNSALQNITTGSYNVAVGTGALQLATVTSDNIAIGNAALDSLVGTFGIQNIAIGSNALTTMGGQFQQGNNTIGIGYNAGYSLAGTLEGNVIVGNNAAEFSTSMDGAIVIGSRSARECAASILRSVLIGSYAGLNATADLTDIVAVGASAGAGTSGSSGFIAMGSSAANAGGTHNNAVCLGLNSFNTSGPGLKTADNAVFVGAYSGRVNANKLADRTGAIGIGYQALSHSILSFGDAQVSTNAISIGANSSKDLTILDISNSIVIGANINPTAPNQIKIGSAAHTGGVNIGPYDIDDIYNGVLPSCLFAALPAVGSVPVGARRYVTDIGVGGSYWFSDGVRWRAVGGSVVLYNNYTDITSVANTNEQILDQYLFPAGLIQVGDIVRVKARIDKSSTVDTCTRRIRLGTAGTVADTITSSIGQPTATNRTLGDQREYTLINSTTVRRITVESSSGWNVNTGTAADVTISNISNALYLSYSTQMGTGVDTITLKDFVVELITCGA